MSNLDKLHRQIIAAARAEAPNERVPYAFEKRVLACLAPSRVDLLGAWSTALWRAALSCTVVMLLCGAWALWNGEHSDAADFSQELESAVYANADSGDEAW
jgi:hypothetical protein